MQNHLPQLLEQVENSPFSQHVDFFQQTARPVVDITASSLPLTPGCSKFGGPPDLPPGTEWPEHPKAYYRFIGQINFSEINVAGSELPGEGLLSLFYAEDEGTGEVFWRNEGYILAIFTHSSENVVPLKPTDNKRVFKQTQRIGFIPGIDIPYDDYQYAGWPFSFQLQESYDVIRNSLHSQNYLLGYPSHYSLAYDPTPGENYVSLMTLDSDSEMKWNWHDGNKLMIFIDKEALKRGDFSALVAEAG